MNSSTAFRTGKGTRNRQSHIPPSKPTTQVPFPTKSSSAFPPAFPFQQLPAPNGPAPYRYDLANLLPAADIQTIKDSGVMVFHTVGDTGDSRGEQQDFVAEMMASDFNGPVGNGVQPSFFYHLGDVVYFAGDIDMYAANFYTTYKDYPGFIVAISGNHDCQPDDPSDVKTDGPVDPDKVPFDGFVKNFMSPDPSLAGSLKTGATRTQMDLPNVYWTLLTPLATIIGLCSNVGESEGEFHQDQIDWFHGELTAVDKTLPLIIAVHHPPFSGDTEHGGSTVVDNMLSAAFTATGVYPDMILSGHVHNYQRFTNTVSLADGTTKEIACVVAGAGGYSKLGLIHQVNGAYPPRNTPLDLGNGLVLENYDQENFGFLRCEVTNAAITATYLSAPYVAGQVRAGVAADSFKIDRATKTVSTGP